MQMDMVLSLIKTVVTVLVLGFIVQLIMSKVGKGKGVKDVDYYLKRGDSKALALLKACLSAYVWLYKTYIKVLFLFVLSYLGVFPNTRKAEEEEEEELEEYLRMKALEDERWEH